MTTVEDPGTEVFYRTCPLCEATCGLEVTYRDGDLFRIRGDRDDVFSSGYICPKGSTLKQLRNDPDRLRRPLIKRDGRHVEASWAEAFTEVENRLMPIVEEQGRQALAVYVGNPNVHNLAGMIHLRALLQALGTPNVFSASTVDQMPKQVSSGLMFGGGLTIPIPDIDRTDYFMVLGANPLASNGSLFTAPDLPGRLDALQERGGRLVVVDPRRSETAEMADEWVPIRPGTDALLLAGMANALAGAGRVDPGPVGEWLNGLDEVMGLLEPFTPEAVEPVCGVPAATIERLALEVADAPSAAVYGRIGTCTTEFGTLASWLVDVVNIFTGNLDRPGGVMFPKAAAGAANTRGEPGKGKGMQLGRRHSRVRGAPEVMGELPVVCLAEEIDTPGEGQVRAMVTVAGNPALSTPNSGRLDAALASLDFMVSVDIYLNETTRHADVVLPPPDALQRGHYDLAFYQLAIRNIANYSPPLEPVEEGQLDEWEILSKLALIAQGQGAEADPSIVDDLVIADQVGKSVRTPGSPVEGRDPDELLAAVGDRRGPERVLDFMLRSGPYGDGFGADPDGLSLDQLIEHPHGIDLGPLEPRIPEVLRTPSGRVEVAPPEIADDMARLRDALERRPERGDMVLVGRRHLRSNNSWMHNINVLVKGKPRCLLQVNPGDAERLGLTHGADAKVASRVGALVAPVEVTDAVMEGVVSLPHGWGHDVDGVRMQVASEKAPGVNSNLLSDDTCLDPLSGNAVLNGIPVTVSPA